MLIKLASKGKVMSNKSLALALLAGGYSQTETQKHLIKDVKTGNYLFEDLIAAIPATTVFIMTSRVYLGFWQQWWVNVSNKTTGKFKDRNISVFLDKGNNKGVTSNPALEMTSRVASLVMNKEIEEVVFAPIDGYYDNFEFVEDLLKEPHLLTVQKGTAVGSEVTFDRHGSVTALTFEASTEEHWGLTGIVKTTTREMLIQGTLSHGSITDVIKRMLVGAHGNSGTPFKVVKIKGWMDVGGKAAYDGAKSLGLIV